MYNYVIHFLHHVIDTGNVYMHSICLSARLLHLLLYYIWLE